VRNFKSEEGFLNTLGDKQSGGEEDGTTINLAGAIASTIPFAHRCGSETEYP
jgi:hypothetical protein